MARAIATYRTDSDFIRMHIESLRDHLAHFIGEEAQVILARLRAEQ